MSKNNDKNASNEVDLEAGEEAKTAKRNLYALRKEFKTSHSKIVKVISESKIIIIQGGNIETLKQMVKQLEQLENEVEVKLQVYIEAMEILERFEDITKEEDKFEIIQGEIQKVRIQMYALITKQEREDCETNPSGTSKQVSEVVPPSSEDSSEFVPRSSEASSESVQRSSKVTSAGTATEEVLVENHSREEDTDQANLNPNANEFKPYSDASAISALIENMSLHQAEPTVFSGDPLKYASWQISFHTLVESKVRDQRKLLYYLYKYTSGEVQELVNAYISTDSVEAYKDAKEALEERYGNVYVIESTLKERLKSWPTIKVGEIIGLRNFADFLKKCEVVKASTQGLNGLDDSDKIISLLRKLPAHIVHKWNDYAFKYVEGTSRNSGSYPGFKDFVKFITEQARQAAFAAPTLQVERQDRVSERPKYKEAPSTRNVRSFATEATIVNNHRDKNAKTYTCIYCNQAHTLSMCDRFISLPVKERKPFVNENRLCYNCLRSGHTAKFCRDPNRCRICNGFHHTLMHEERVPFERRVPENRVETRGGISQNEREQANQAIVNKINASEDNASYRAQALILPIWVYSHDFPEKRILIYAMVDNQSNATFIKESLFERLNLAGSPVDLNIKTISGTEFARSIKCKNLILQGLRSNEKIQLRSSYVRKDIVADRASIPSKEIARKYEHLHEVCDEMISEIPMLDIEMLIGLDCPEAIEPLRVITGDKGTPFGFQSRLGWGIVGITPETSNNSVQTSECKAIVNHSIVAFQAETKEIHKHENVRKDERTKSEDKIKMELENQRKVLAKELENTKAHLKERENLIQEKAAIIKEFQESKQILESRVENILKGKENDRLFNEERNAKLEQQRLLERQSFEALLNEKEREKRNLLDIIQGKEKALHENKGERLEMQIMLQRVKNEKLETENTLQETEQKMVSSIKERELEIKNLHALNESVKQNLSKEISEANSEIQRLRELLTERDQVLKVKQENEDSINEGQDVGTEHINKKPVLIPEPKNEKAEVLQIKMDKENMQTKLEMFSEKAKGKFCEINREKQKINIQPKRIRKGVLIKEKRVHSEKLKEGKRKLYMKLKNLRNNWRLAIEEKAFVGQDEGIRRVMLSLGKRALGNHRKRKKRPVHPVVLLVPRETGYPSQGALFSSKIILIFGGAMLMPLGNRLSQDSLLTLVTPVVLPLPAFKVTVGFDFSCEHLRYAIVLIFLCLIFYLCLLYYVHIYFKLLICLFTD